MTRTAPSVETRGITADRFLRRAAILYVAGLVLHSADHLRRGSEVLTPGVMRAGAISTIAGVAVLALIFKRHRRAPIAAAVFGFPVALGIAAVHLLPRWSSLSDAFPGASGTGVTAMSWSVVIIEIAGALALGFAGAAARRSSA